MLENENQGQKCDACGSPLPAGAQACEYCGTAVNGKPRPSNAPAAEPAENNSKLPVKGIVIGIIVIAVLALGSCLAINLFSSKPAPAKTPVAPAAAAKAAPKAATAPKIPTATTLTAINLRATPSAKGKLVKAVAKGQTVSVIGAPKNGWQMVTHGKDKGWVTVGSIKKN